MFPESRILKELSHGCRTGAARPRALFERTGLSVLRRKQTFLILKLPDEAAQSFLRGLFVHGLFCLSHRDETDFLFSGVFFMKRHCVFCALLSVLVCAASFSPASAGELTVFAAASLQKALEELSSLYRKDGAAELSWGDGNIHIKDLPG